MQNPVGAVQTEQWSWILQTVWRWIWGGLSWILDWQAYVFQVVAGGESFWATVAKFVLLFFPATVLVVGRGTHGVVLLVGPGPIPRRLRRLDLGITQAHRQHGLANPEERGHVALRPAGFLLPLAGRAVDRLRPAALLVDDRGDDLHLHAAADDGRAARGPHGLRSEPPVPRRHPVVLPLHHHRVQLRLHPGAERCDQDPAGGADRLHGAGRDHRRPVRGAVPVSRADRRHHALARPAGHRTGGVRDPHPRLPRVGRRSRHDLVPVRPVRRARPPRHPRTAGDGGTGGRTGAEPGG